MIGRRCAKAMFAGAVAMILAAPAQSGRDEVAFFISNMVERHGMDSAQLEQLFAELKPVPSIVKAATAPATSRPWHEYRGLVLDKKRIEAGVDFWQSHQGSLTRAREVYGVPEHIIVAIIGAETRYGKVLGNHRVVDALYTLGFELPGRNEYFKSELEAFLLLAREQGWNPTHIKGSYAGAMGMPQFMPNSYRKYAVDFDGDGAVNLWTSVADVIGSVAGFLQHFGWRKDEPIALATRVDGVDVHDLLAMGLRPHTPVARLQEMGVVAQGMVDDRQLAALFTLEAAAGPEHWLGFENFSTLLQYNRSRNYAMSVYQLALEIMRERARRE